MILLKALPDSPFFAYRSCMLFDLTDLRLFIFIAELKSLTRAAERITVVA